MVFQHMCFLEGVQFVLIIEILSAHFMHHQEHSTHMAPTSDSSEIMIKRKDCCGCRHGSIFPGLTALPFSADPAAAGHPLSRKSSSATTS